MKKTYKFLILFVLAAIGFQSCQDMDDTLNVPSDLEIHNFIWKGLNLYYLWQADVPDLADDRFDNQSQLNDFLRTEGTPENLFQDLLYKPVSKFPNGGAVDRFSVLVDDYVYLENLFQGVTKNNGVDFKLYLKPGSDTDVFGVVRYIIPGSDAATKDIQRGDLFDAVNGTPLTKSNYQALLATDTYTLNLADYNGGAITPNGTSVSLTKSQLTENPVFETRIIEQGSHKVAYLMYNAFVENFEPQLNAAFAEFKAAGATDLVLDLRYNGGGAVTTATRLASMITGQFNGQLFAHEQWNDKVQAYFEDNNPGRLNNNFTNKINDGATINSLNLNKVYVIASKSTASASELIINGLTPYIDVVQVGDVTVGKNVASITLYDSPTFNKEDVNPHHKYAMQPLVLKISNKAGFSAYENGLAPDIVLPENLSNLGVLGDPSEPLLAAALANIAASGRMMPPQPAKLFQEVKDLKGLRRFGTDMYVETPREMPALIRKWNN